MNNKVKTGLILPQGTFNKATFAELMNRVHDSKLKAVPGRLIVREEITMSPNKLYLSALNMEKTEDERNTSLADLHPQRRYFIEDISAGLTTFDGLEGSEVLLDWSGLTNMLRIDGRGATPTLIEAAAAIGSLKFDQRTTLSAMKDVTIYEYLAVHPMSIIALFEEGSEPKELLGELSVNTTPKILLPNQ